MPQRGGAWQNVTQRENGGWDALQSRAGSETATRLFSLGPVEWLHAETALHHFLLDSPVLGICEKSQSGATTYRGHKAYSCPNNNRRVCHVDETQTQCERSRARKNNQTNVYLTIFMAYDAWKITKDRTLSHCCDRNDHTTRMEEMSKTAFIFV